MLRVSCHGHSPMNRITVAQIQTFCAKMHGLPVVTMCGPQQIRRIAHVRMLAMALARELTDRSSTELGIAFCRDHTTVLYGLRFIARRLRGEDASDALAADWHTLRLAFARGPVRCTAVLRPLAEKSACLFTADLAAIIRTQRDELERAYREDPFGRAAA